MTFLTSRFSEAATYAAHLHREQLRKGTDIPYLAHLFGVASLALEHGADEDQAIAALLHDAIEDQSRDGATRREIGERFGAAVLAIVEGCTDAEGDADGAKPPWRARKEAYVAHLRSAPAATRLVSNSDKLHNARAILSDYHVVGESLWTRFTGGKDGTLWYYRALVDAFVAADSDKRMSRLIGELDRTVHELEGLAQSDGNTA